jgi:hypothetical protein
MVCKCNHHHQPVVSNIGAIIIVSAPDMIYRVGQSPFLPALTGRILGCRVSIVGFAAGANARHTHIGDMVCHVICEHSQYSSDTHILTIASLLAGVQALNYSQELHGEMQSPRQLAKPTFTLRPTPACRRIPYPPSASSVPPGVRHSAPGAS